MPELPSGTVTFLFTDLEGSTALWEHQSEAMRLALARHDALVRAAIAEHGGHVVKTMGDAFHAVFRDAPDALAAAIDAQRRLQAEPWGETGALRARMALHTGSAEERDGDYYGPPLNRVARLMSAGHGGQVLLSGLTADLVQGALPAGASLLDLGEHRLRDLIHPERIFQVAVPDLPTDFPPLRTLSAHPNNLPTHPTALLGREREVAELRRLLEGGARLVTLTGPGGTGKTRLCIQVAAELLDHVADGVFLIDLAAIGDPALVPASIARVLDVRDAGSRPVLDRLKELLREKSLLLVLDNFEQILPSATVVAELLAASPRLKILVTSRAPLRLRGEREYPVSPLPIPAAGHVATPDRLAQFAAVSLFLERAATIRPGFALTSENAAAISEICVRLDGLPLAIELAAARIRLLTPQAMVGRLDRRLPLLTGGARDLPARQQTLRDTIAWSHDLLDEPERRLFRRLAVFVGGWALESAERVVSDEVRVASDAPALSQLAPHDSILDGLESLVAKSLVRQEEQPDGDVRFRMLETIREYALEQLEASGEGEAIRRRHADHYLAFAERIEPLIEGAEGEVWLDRLQTEDDNVRAVLGWSLLAPSPEGTGVAPPDRAGLGLRLAASLWEFWHVHGHYHEGRQWLETALASNPGAAPHLRAKALRGAGQLIYSQGDYHEGLAHDAEALALYREIGDTHSAAWVLIGIGTARRNQRDYASAEAVFAEALTLFRRLEDRWGVAWAYNGLGNVAQEQGDHSRAEALLTEAITRFDDLGDKRGGAWATLSLGHDARVQGDHTRAQQLFDTALAWFHELDNRRGILHTTHGLGMLAYAREDSLRAWDFLRDALRQARELGDRRGIYECVEWLAALAGMQEQLVRAARLHGAADAMREAIGTLLPLADRVHLERGLEAVRAALGESAFAAAWAEGRAMTIEQAVDLALEGPGEDASAGAS